jgi:2-polyprenyl-6-methoxyphenol hydroxylase-like FAD-dependent oxidoreductase
MTHTFHEEISVIVVRDAAPPLPAWRSSRVTLVGDSKHGTMPGFVLNTCLRDAQVLGQFLCVVGGETSVAERVGAYEHVMRGYTLSSTQTGARCARAAMLYLHASPRIRRWAQMMVKFAGWGMR